MWDLSDNFTNKERKGHHLMDAHNLEGNVLSAFTYIITYGKQHSIVAKSIDTKIRVSGFTSQQCDLLIVNLGELIYYLNFICTMAVIK